MPQISAILGPCAGGAVYSPAITDFVFMTEKTSYLFVTGPDVIRTVTHEEVTKEELGGARTHASVSGVAHFVRQATSGRPRRDPRAALLPAVQQPRRPAAPGAARGAGASREDLTRSFRRSPTSPTTWASSCAASPTRGVFLEVHAGFARNMLVGFIRLAGRPVGVVANQPMHLAGVLDIDASVKGARFVRFCDAFNIPLLVFEDVPGFLPGTQQEYGGIIRHGAKLLYAFAEATVPKVSVITRKAYGGAYCVMLSKDLGDGLQLRVSDGGDRGDGAGGRRQHPLPARAAADARPKRGPRRWPSTWRTSPIPTSPRSRGYLDEIIEPSETRERLITAFRLLEVEAGAACRPRSTATSRCERR